MREMKRFKLLIAAILILGLALIFGCTEPAEKIEEEDMETVNEVIVEETDDVAAEEIVLTLDELKKYNGTDGYPAYIAYDGIIYDVSNVAQWKSGSHGGNMAGTDITDILGGVSHGTSKLDDLTAVGKIGE